MSSRVESDSYTVPQLGTVPILDVTVTADNNTGDRTILVLNRDLTADREAAFEFAGAPPKRVLVCETLTGSDLSDPSCVAPSKLEPPKVGPKMTFKLPPRSFTVIRLANLNPHLTILYSAAPRRKPGAAMAFRRA